jgi:O-antigen ligase
LAVTLTLGLLLRYCSTARRLETLAYVLIAIGIASALFGLLRSHLPDPLLTAVNSRLPLPESYGQLRNRNHFALLMEMTIGLVLGLGIADRGRWKRLIVYASSGLILWTALLLTHSRGGVLALLLEVVFLFLLISFTGKMSKSGKVGEEIPKRVRARHLVTSVVALTMIVAGVWASVVMIGGEETIGRLEMTPDEFVSHTNSPPKLLRPQIWQASLELIKENAIVGVGFAGYATAITRHVNASGQWTLEEAHNDYLELIASGGVVAAALCIWFFALFIRLSTYRLRNAVVYERALICGALAGLFAVAVHSFFDFGLHITVNSLVCAGLITLVVKTGSASPTR